MRGIRVILVAMEVRPTVADDVDSLLEIDGVIDSSNYLRVERAGEGLGISWRLDERPLRTRLIERNAMDDEVRFGLRQIISGADEGLALLAEHEGRVVASLVALIQPSAGLLRLLDLRVDFDQRRQGLATVLLYRLIQEARDRGLRAVMAQTRTNNLPAAKLLLKTGFDIAGLDAQFHSNHDLVKEAVTLFWYAALD